MHFEAEKSFKRTGPVEDGLPLNQGRVRPGSINGEGRDFRLGGDVHRLTVPSDDMWWSFVVKE